MWRLSPFSSRLTPRPRQGRGPLRAPPGRAPKSALAWGGNDGSTAIPWGMSSSPARVLASPAPRVPSRADRGCGSENPGSGTELGDLEQLPRLLKSVFIHRVSETEDAGSVFFGFRFLFSVLPSLFSGLYCHFRPCVFP